MLLTDDPPFTGFNVDNYKPPARWPGRASAPPTPRPKLAVRTLARGNRDASLALVEYSLPRPDRRLPQQAADFLKSLAANELRVLYADGVIDDDPASGSGSHTGFTVLAEHPGKTPEDLKTLLTEQARDLLGGDVDIESV